MERLRPVLGGTKFGAARFERLTPGLVVAVIGIPAISVTVAGANLVALLGTILGWTLLWLAVIDAREFRLPDRLTLPLLAGGLLSGLLLHPAHIGDHLIGAAAGYALFRLVEATFRASRGRHGLGRGDAKLIAAGGAWVAWYGLPSVVLIASLLGIAQALATGRLGGPQTSRMPLPFGPALGLAIWMVWLFGPFEWRGLW